MSQDGRSKRRLLGMGYTGVASCTLRAATKRHTSATPRDGPEHEKEEERLCNVCVTGKIETESHFLLECYVYNRLREGMFEKINQITGYNLLTMRDNKDWMMDVLLGHGLKRKEVREQIGKAVATFIAVAMRIRTQNLN